jgi:hypothetical protein
LWSERRPELKGIKTGRRLLVCNRLALCGINQESFPV